MKHLAIIAAVIALFLLLAHSYVSPAPFSYDEADYMYAAGRGWAANYLDSPSLSFSEYVQVGLSRGRDPSQKTALSQTVRKAGDMFFYRHAHGPVYFYWLSLLSRWSVNEYCIRALSLIFPLITAVLIYFGCLWILPAPQGSIAGILASVAYVCSPAVFRTTEVAPHQLFVLWFIATLLLLAKVLATGERRFWHGAVAIAALAFCTLEVTFVLIAVVLVCGYLERRRLGMDWRLALRSVSLFAAVVVFVHPATVSKLAFAKSYIYYVYLALQRKGPWGNVTFFETWESRFTNSPVEWLLVGVALFLWLRFRHLPGRREAIPALFFGTLMLATMLRVFTTGARYMLPFVPALHLVVGIVLSGVLVRWRPAMRVTAIVLVSAGLLFTAALYKSAHPFQPDPRASLLLAEIRQLNLASGRLLVPHDDLPTLHYYFPGADLAGYVDEPPLPTGSFDAVVRMSDPVRIDLVNR